jgi:hypothetical protein
MTDGLWRASCGCGWRSAPSPDLGEQTDELDAHLRVVVVAEQQPSRAGRAVTTGLLQVVDHTLVLCGLLIGLGLAAPALVRRT